MSTMSMIDLTACTEPSSPAADILSGIQHWEHWDTITQVAHKEYALSSEQVSLVLPEYQRFLGLIAAGYSPLGMYSEAVDQLWHAHLLCTRLYASFCEQFFGRFIHHTPTLEQNIESDAPSAPCTYRCLSICKTPAPSCKEEEGAPTTLVAFVNAYEHFYGMRPPAIWNLPSPEGRAG